MVRFFKAIWFGLLQRLLDVGDDVVHVFDADGEADEVGSDAGLAELLVGELTMGVAGWMEDTAAGIGYVGDDADELQTVHKADGILARSLQSEGNNAARAVWQVLLAEDVIGVVGQAAVVDPRHLIVPLKPFGYRLGIFAMAFHAQVEGFKPKVQVIGVLWSLDAAEVAHKLGGSLGDVGGTAEALGIDEAVIGIVGRGEAREKVGMGIPVEVAAIDDDTPHSTCMTIHILGGGVGDDVGSPLNGTAVDGRSEGVVDDKGHAVLVRQTGKALDVQHFAAWVADGFAEDTARIGAESLLQLLVSGILIDEGDVDAHLLHRDAKEVECASVDGAGADDVAAALADVKRGKEVGSLPAGGEHGAYASFKVGNLRGYHVVGGVLQTGVEIA